MNEKGQAIVIFALGFLCILLTGCLTYMVMNNERISSPVIDSINNQQVKENEERDNEKLVSQTIQPTPVETFQEIVDVKLNSKSTYNLTVINQPFDLNEHSKLELGSTAKLRVLASYLEIIAELHQAFVDELPDSLLTMDIAPNDNITRWAANYMATTADRSLPAMLEASLERTYPASPAERFFTGGGLQVFNNFNKDEDGKVPTIRQSLQQSHNLPFVRLLRDIVSYASSYQTQGSTSLLLRADNDPKREEYLRKFVDKEGSEFLRRFFRKYQQKPMDERLETFFDGLKQTPDRLAAVHRYLLPDASFTDFAAFLRTKLPDADNLTNKKLQDMYAQYGPGKFSLPD